MSRHPELSDAELRDRVLRSMEHYRAARSLRVVGRTSQPSWPRRALPLLAFVAGAVATVAVIQAVQPLGGPRPSIDRGALELCQPHQAIGFIPDDWLEPGETRAAIIDELRNLPLAARLEDRGLVIYLFSDGRFGASCVTVDNGGGSLGASVIGGRPMLLDGDEAVRVDGADTDPGGPVVVSGTAGDGVERVDVVRSDGERIPAALAAGVWAAWWPERVGGISAEAFDPDGEVRGSHDVPVDVAPPAPPISDDDAREGCLTDEVIPEEFRLPSEDFDEAQERVRNLPLLVVHHGPHASTFFFGDESYWVHCTVDRLAEGVTSSSGPRSTGDGAVTVRSGQSSSPWDVPDPVIAGEAAPDAARVSVELSDGSLVDAQLAGGYWLASWESVADVRTVRAYDAEGNELGSTSVPGP